MRTLTLVLPIAGLLLVSSISGAAQGGPFDLKTMNFDLWCQEEQHLTPERCDRRLPGDETAFETYRDKVEKYEVPYLRSRETGQQLDRAILHNDPIDNPLNQDPAAVSQSPTSPGTKPHP